MVTLSDIQQKRVQILKLAEKYGADNIRVFGSVVRGTAGPDSDLDLLVRLQRGRSLIDHIGLIQSLEKLLGVKVDVVTETALHPAIRDRVLSEGIAL